MKIITLKNVSAKRYQRLLVRSSGLNESIIPKVVKIMRLVEQRGDEYLYEKYRNRFGESMYTSLQVSQEEIKFSYEETNTKTIQALEQMKKNIYAVQKAQLPRKIDKVVRSENGIRVWREWRAIEKVGLYIPGGNATYPSSVLMTGIPALIAGCKEIIMCSPPKMDGKIPAVTLVAADLIGINKIFKVGGIEAIAAMTYGTKTIPNVYKIFGAGNSYVTAAKSIAQKTIGIDMPAGPSEVLIIADETANPAFIAADLLADGEHGEDSACVLVTTSQSIAIETNKQVEIQLAKLSTKARAQKALESYGLIIRVDSIEEAIQFSNDYAPEHLEIMTRYADSIVSKINNAGSVFVGNYTTKSSGDYATGANHVLPTGGMAKMYPPLGVDTFGKWMQVQKCTKNGLQSIKKTIETIAEVEQLPAHKESVSIRFR